MTYPYLISDRSIVVFIDGEPVNVEASHPNFTLVRQALKDKDWEQVKKLSTVRNAINTFGAGRVVVNNTGVYYDGNKVSYVVAEKIFRMMNEGFDVTPLVNFLERVMQNPSASAVEELWLFLEHNDLAITPDGRVLAYKAIKSNWTDCHTGTVDNSVGNIISMPRNKVDDRRDVTCSHGLHVANLDYAKAFHSSGRLIVVAVDPADFVSIPNDYSNQKARVCRYEVVSELTNIRPHDKFVVDYNEDEDSDNYYFNDDDNDSDYEDDDQFNIGDVTVTKKA